MNTTWERKMIIVLLAWCVILAVWNGVQSYHIQELATALRVTQDCLMVTQESMTNLIGVLRQ